MIASQDSPIAPPAAKLPPAIRPAFVVLRSNFPGYDPYYIRGQHPDGFPAISYDFDEALRFANFGAMMAWFDGLSSFGRFSLFVSKIEVARFYADTMEEIPPYKSARARKGA